MKQGIEKILDWISLVIATDNSSNLDPSQTNLIVLSDNIIQEVENIRQELVRSVFAISRPVEAECLIQNYQTVLIRLLDEVYAFKAAISHDKNAENLYNSIIDALSTLLFFIEKYFARYFNIDEKVPNVYYFINKHEFGQQYYNVKIALEEKLVTPELVNILLSKFKETDINPQKEAVTYRYFIYLKELLNEVVLIKDSAKEEDLNFVIESLLIYLNYNDPPFIIYFINKISYKLNSLQNTEDKILALKFQQKNTNQINSRPGVGLHII